jgi:hypothetical protein
MENFFRKAERAVEMTTPIDHNLIDQALADIRKKLHLSTEAENEILAEIRTHLEDAAVLAKLEGGDQQEAIDEVLNRFGIEEVGKELQEVHSGRESIEAIAATALPILFALILRWLAFSPDGTYAAWSQLLVQPAFWSVAAAALVIPILLFRRLRFALVSWGIFWLITVIFVVFPAINRW